MQSIHQKELVAYLRARIPPVASPQFCFIGANDGFSDDTQSDGLDFIWDFLLSSPWWSATFIEPIPSIFKKLKNNYFHHNNKLTFMNVAVSGVHGVEQLNIYGRDGKASSLVYDEFEQEKYTGYSMREQEGFRINSDTPESGKIKVLTLPYKEILQITGLEKFHFIKIDAEGKDHEIVKDILDVSKLYDQYPSCIYFEDHATSKSLIRDLFKHNYITFPSGFTQHGKCIDQCAIRRDFLREGSFPPNFILENSRSN